MKIADRYIAKEILSPFIVSLLATTALMLIGRMVRFFDLIIAKGVSVKEVSLLFLYMSPFILALAIPISVLVSVVLAFNRLSTDSEIIAMKAIGIDLARLSRTPFYFGLLCYALTSFVSFYLLPTANIALRNEFFDIIIRKTTVGINEKAFNTLSKNITFYVDSLSPDRQVMNDVLIYDTRNPDFSNTIVARRGRFVVDKRDNSIILVMNDGTIQQLSDTMETMRIVNFREYDLAFSQSEISPSMTNYNKTTFEMTIPELIGMYEKLKKQNKRTNSLLTDIAERFAIPFTAIIFSIIGIPLGIRSPRSGKAYGITIAAVVVLLYYIVLSGAETVGKLNIVNPVVAISFVDLFFLVVSVALFYMVSLEKDLRFMNPLTHIRRDG
ncbi:MAG: LPS export ABC transporter permease LptF [Deltaproteobacteria bacterium]|nr:LPS export ABC transporter permease LptF [Deltaproteobacteria bacterium]MCL5277703.1 LPS export ABC transporter permease LptF [Deltaproteobacteria bacterium]